MSWLKDLEKYIKKYESNINENSFEIINKVNGPGMGALIEFQNSNLKFQLVNDKLYFEIQVYINASKKIDLAPLLAFINTDERGIDLTKLTFKDKIEYWQIKYDYKDPLESFFINIDKIYKQISDSEALEKRLHAYYDKRGDWLFPKQ